MELLASDWPKFPSNWPCPQNKYNLLAVRTLTNMRLFTFSYVSKMIVKEGQLMALKLESLAFEFAETFFD